MSVPTISFPVEKLLQLGLRNSSNIHYQLSPEELVQQSLERNEGTLNDAGALVIHTGKFTGRSPKDKFIVKDQQTAETVDWNAFNIPLEPHYFDVIFDEIMAYMNRIPEMWVRDCYACADPRYRLNIRVVNEKPWMNLFAHNMFLRPKEEELETFRPDWHIVTAPGLQLNPETSGTRQGNAAVVSFRHKMILIAGTGYTGEMKKGIFTILNYVLPVEHNILSMHCSANMGKSGDTAIFFGLSGTGKTTLSADPWRKLIGDDEHAWTNDNVFNFEGGCYAKCIDLSPEKEPAIFNAIRPGALLENVVFKTGTNEVDYSDGSITENTRVSYPLHYISNALEPSMGNTPKNIFFLTCDAYGVLPPISKLTPGQAMYQFISGYTAKVAGTEAGVTEPVSTFSACFGAPFLPLHPGKYAAMLGEKMRRQSVNVWLVNTGWTGGPFGTGKRIDLGYTRAMIAAALEGKLDNAAFTMDPVFRLAIPVSCPGVPSQVLIPKQTWNDAEAYDAQAKKLAAQFIKNFEKYTAGVTEEILLAGPRI